MGGRKHLSPRPAARAANELDTRELLRYAGGRRLPRRGRRWQRGLGPGDYGIIVATCDLGEVRQSRDGLYVYDDDGRHDEPLPADATLRGNEVGELPQGDSGRRRRCTTAPGARQDRAGAGDHESAEDASRGCA